MRTNLDYLRSMSNGSPELIIELIDIFNDQVIEFAETMQDNLNDKDYDALERIAHKAKSTVAIMGMTELTSKLKDLEMKAKKLEDIDTFQKSVDYFKEESLAAINELNQYKEKVNPN